MKAKLEELIGFKPPDELVRILNAFSDRYGGFEEGAEAFMEKINAQDFYHVSYYNGYEGTPVEYFPFIGTGGDGISIGYLILAPELELADYPMIDYEPGGGYVSFHGNSTKEGLDNFLGEDDNHDEPEIAFLNSIGLCPKKEEPASDFFAVNYDPDELITLPVLIPDGYSYKMTNDGVGVLASSDLFSKTHIQCGRDTSTEVFLNEIEFCVSEGFWASALYYLKEAWKFKYYEETNEVLKRISDMKVEVYTSLNRPKYAEEFKRHSEFLEKEKVLPPTPAMPNRVESRSGGFIGFLQGLFRAKGRQN